MAWYDFFFVFGGIILLYIGVSHSASNYPSFGWMAVGVFGTFIAFVGAYRLRNQFNDFLDRK
jgi:hypothetical protein